jgi:hypothetical protein
MTKTKTPVEKTEPVIDIETATQVSEEVSQEILEVISDPEAPDVPNDEEVDEFVPPLKERAKSVFASHSVDVLYFTADGCCFIELYNAEAHAANLGDGKILTIKREEV